MYSGRQSVFHILFCPVTESDVWLVLEVLAAIDLSRPCGGVDSNLCNDMMFFLSEFAFSLCLGNSEFREGVGGLSAQQSSRKTEVLHVVTMIVFHSWTTVVLLF